jgi:hypothetical protein
MDELTVRNRIHCLFECSWCHAKFRLGERIVKTNTKRYHKKCFEKLQH